MVSLGTGPSLTANTTTSQTAAANPASGFWSPTPPLPSGKAPANAVRIVNPRIAPAYVNDLGCAGIPEGSQGDPYWYCRGSNYNQYLGRVIVVRVGAYNNPIYPGLYFGWAKAFYKHELDLQPILTAIGQGTPGTGDNSNTLSDFHYNADLDVNMQVRVVTLTGDDVSGYSMNNTGPVGVLTAYCAAPDYPENPGATRYPTCPAWVNTSL